MVELVDTLVSGTSAARLGGSSPLTCTKKNPSGRRGFLVSGLLDLAFGASPGHSALRPEIIL